tara:strand:- start:399 stop:758 length:360 start_codon:yes stop_codon:yes gene_type:complete
VSQRLRHNYKNLKIWKVGIEIGNQIFDLSSNFPPEEKYSLTSQINRSAISIPSNIAEGSSRTDKSFSRIIDISLGSSFELGTQLILAEKRKFITEKELNQIEEKLEEFQKMSMVFQNRL